MICWGKEQTAHVGRLAERAATGAMVIFAAYLLGHLIAAWLRGSFEVVR